jgi:hypothetical protein
VPRCGRDHAIALLTGTLLTAWGCGRVGFQPRLDASREDTHADSGTVADDAFDRHALDDAALDDAALDDAALDDAALDAVALDAVALDAVALDAATVDAVAVDAVALDAGAFDACTPTVFYGDSDGDGHGDPPSGSSRCAPPAGWVTAGDDCDDSSRWIHPGAPELCDGRDDDCDDRTVEACPASGTGYFWNGTPYLRVTDGATFAEAVRACTAAGMSLATVESEAEQSFLESISAGQTLWLGGTDGLAEGEWLWIEGGRMGPQFWRGGPDGRAFAGTYQAWQPGVEPNSSGDEDCLVLWSGYAGKWADEWCGLSYGYLCSL